MTTSEQAWLAERFETHRPHLRAVAYRMLGSLSEAEDAVQEGWLRLSRADTSDVANLGGWLTTVVGRVCLDMLRSRRSRHEESLDVRVPDPIVELTDGVTPESEALLGDAVGLALLVVLETLAPAERLAFVLHDMFGVSFNEIGSMMDRPPNTAAQLASRARRRVRGAATPDADLGGQRQVVEAFFAAARNGDFEGLVAVLDPDVVLRHDFGEDSSRSGLIRGARAVAAQALLFSGLAPFSRRAIVNGELGFVAAPHGRLFAVLAYTVRNGKIVEINVLADPERLRQLDLPL